MPNRLGRQIYLVGINRLLYELLAQVIIQHTETSCKIVTALPDVPPAKGHAEPKRLVLYDSNNSYDVVKKFSGRDMVNILHSDYLVLINLSRTLGVEHEAIKYGVRGFLYNQSGIATLLKMIDSVFNGELWVPRELMSELMFAGRQTSLDAGAGYVALTSREIDVLNGISKGLTNVKIADMFCLSPHTIRTHIYHIFKKIDVVNRLQAAQWASRNI